MNKNQMIDHDEEDIVVKTKRIFKNIAWMTLITLILSTVIYYILKNYIF